MMSCSVAQAGVQCEISAHCLLSSSNFPTSASEQLGLQAYTTVPDNIFFFVFLVEMGFHHFGQDGLDLLTS